MAQDNASGFRHDLYHRAGVKRAKNGFLRYSILKNDFSKVMSLEYDPRGEKRRFSPENNEVFLKFFVNNADMLVKHKNIVRAMLCDKLIPPLLRDVGDLRGGNTLSRAVFFTDDARSHRYMDILGVALERFSKNGAFVMEQISNCNYPALMMRL